MVLNIEVSQKIKQFPTFSELNINNFINVCVF